MTVEAPSELTLLHAAPYEISGVPRRGKVHCIREGERTYCGQQLRYTGGTIQPGNHEDITCKGCLRSLETAEQRQQEEHEWEERRAQQAAERERESQEWWDWYNSYLKTPAWALRRSLVMDRCHGRCEGCRQASAFHVHHLTYEHAGNELLFELVALCRDCHQIAHPHKVIG